jgi:hypothetical protein
MGQPDEPIPILCDDLHIVAEIRLQGALVIEEMGHPIRWGEQRGPRFHRKIVGDARRLVRCPMPLRIPCDPMALSARPGKGQPPRHGIIGRIGGDRRRNDQGD